MEFQITLEKKCFDFAMLDRLSFDAWGHVEGTTIFMNYTGDGDETFWLQHAVFPAVQNFLRRLELNKFLPGTGEKYGEILTPSGGRISLPLQCHGICADR